MTYNKIVVIYNLYQSVFDAVVSQQSAFTKSKMV